MINWTVSKTEHALIADIADRTTAMAQRNNINYDRITVEMDITAVHANGCPLRLEELLSAEPFDFSHDVFGIRKNLNRETGELEHCFLPRFAKR